MSTVRKRLEYVEAKTAFREFLLVDLTSYTNVQIPTLRVRRKLGVWQTNSPSAHFKKCIKRFRKLATASAKSRKKMRRFARKD